MIVLGSRSPRRAELLTAAGLEFKVRVADIDETPRPGEDPREYTLRMAREKAMAIPVEAGETVLTADTTVVLDGEILGKPVDRADAVRMMRLLAGRRHEVITGICLRRGEDLMLDSCTTAVRFGPMSEAEIGWYVDSGEPMDKAGGYGIQGLASRFVEGIEGSYSNVVGLPVELVYRHLTAVGR